MNNKLSSIMLACFVFAGTMCLPLQPLMAMSTGTITIAHVEAETGTQVDVPVVVTGFQNFDIFQFSFQYNQETAEYVDIVDTHPALDGQTFLDGEENGVINVTFFGSGSGHTIPDGGTLFKLRFNFCSDPLSCAQNNSISEIIFDMSGQNYVLKPDWSSILLTFNNGSIEADPPLRILTVETAGSGTVAVDGTPYTEPIVVEDGTSLELAATPAEDWLFQAWSGDLSGSENPTNVNMDAHKSITATFIRQQFTLTVNTIGNGSVEVDGTPYTEVLTIDAGETVSLLAEPDMYWQFDNWSGALSGSENPKDLLMDGNKEVTANLSQPEYTLTVTIVGEGDVTVGSESYTAPVTVAAGTILSIAANPATDWYFEGWSGNLIGSSSPVNLLMDGNKDVTATFSEEQQVYHTLTVIVDGEGEVKVDGSIYESPITVVEGTTLNLEALAAEWWEFDGWSGNVPKTGNILEVTMDEDKEITATFTRKQFTLAITAIGDGSVKVDGTTYTEELTINGGETVSLLAEPDLYWQFDEWTGALSGSDNPKDLLMDGDKTVTATFIRQQFTLTVNTIGNGSVEVDGTPYTEVLTIDAGETVSLLAEPDIYWQFDEWTCALSGSDNPKDLLMDGDKTVTATFTRQQFTLTVNTIGNGSVEVDGTPYTEVLTIDAGETVSLLAEPDTYWQFDGWSGDLTGTNPTESIVMDSDKDVAATFSELPPEMYTLTVTIIGSGSVTVNDEAYTVPVTVVEGTTINLEAIAAAGHEFDGWSGDLTGANPTESIVMDSDKDVAATFTEEHETPEHREVHNVTVTGSETVCFDALKTITAWDFIVESGGEAHFLAGERISFLPGTHIKAGANFHARITADEFCITEKEEYETVAGDFIDGIYDRAENETELTLAFRVYPNPTTGSFTLEMKHTCGDDQLVIEIMNMTGNLVLRQQLPSTALHTFSLEQQQPGIYLLRVICENQTATQRLIKH